MTDAATLLPYLKIDLGISTAAYDSRLTQYIQHAQVALQRAGITLNSGDDQLTVMYAAWQWRKRDTGEGMPRMLRIEFNSRLFSEKMVT